MSIWCSIPSVPAKSYVHSAHDPRKRSDRDEIDLAVVPDYVYDDKGDGSAVLPYLRVSIGSKSVILTEAQARRLIHELVTFRTRPKFRGRSPRES